MNLSFYSRPGRHFVYVHNYLVVLIKLLSQTQDMDVFKIVIRKIRRSYPYLLWPDKIWVEVNKSLMNLLISSMDLKRINKTIAVLVSHPSLDTFLEECEQKITSLPTRPPQLSYIIDLCIIQKSNEGAHFNEEFNHIYVSLYADLIGIVNEMINENDFNERIQNENPNTMNHERIENADYIDSKELCSMDIFKRNWSNLASVLPHEVYERILQRSIQFCKMITPTKVKPVNVFLFFLCRCLFLWIEQYPA